MRRLAVFLLGVLGCAEAKTPALTALDYNVTFQSVEPAILQVEVVAKGKRDLAFELDPKGLLSVEIEDGNGKSKPGPDDGAIRANCDPACSISYQYDLSRAAKGGRERIRGSHEREGEILVDGPTWLLHPKPNIRGTKVDLRIHPAEGLAFTSGMRPARESEHYALRSEELAGLGLMAFGKKPGANIKVNGGEVATYVFPGKRRVSDATIERWVKQSASVFDQLYGHFPVQRAAVFLVPYAGSSSVDFGVAMGSGGATIVILLGEEADEKALLVDDWVLVHEMFHLGVPSFRHHEVWLNEGLATYYEPLLRTRAGHIAPNAYWETLAKEMPKGVSTTEPLQDAHSFQRMYWGGAFLAMRADVEIRRRTNGKASLDDGLAALLADGGDIGEVYSIKKIAEIVQASVGVDVLGELVSEANRGQKEERCHPDRDEASWPPHPCASEADTLKSLLWALGIRKEGAETTLRSDAQLATIRDEMVSPKRTDRLAQMLKLEPLSFARTSNGRGLGIEEIGIMNEPHSIANFLR